MTGSLKKRTDHSWSIILYLGRDPVTGRKRQRWHTVTGTKKDAERELNRLLHELDNGTYIEPCKLTLGNYLRKWLSDYARANVSAKTFERYAGIVEQHLIPALGSIILTRLQPLQVQGYYSNALETGRRDGRDGGLSAQTVLHHHRILHPALKQAVRWQMVSRNVCDAVEPPRPAFHEINALSAMLIEHLQSNTESTGRECLDAILDQYDAATAQNLRSAGLAMLTELQQREAILGTRV